MRDLLVIIMLYFLAIYLPQVIVRMQKEMVVQLLQCGDCRQRKKE